MNDWTADIEKYHKGELSPSEMHALEKRSLSDPFLAEALEGSGSIPSNEFASDLRNLQEKILKANKVVWLTPLRIAAGIIVIIGIGWFVLLINPGEKNDRLASKTEKAQEQAPSTVSADSSSNIQPPAEKGTEEPKDETLLSLNDQNNSKDKKQEPVKPVVVPDPEAATTTKPLDKNPTDASGVVQADELLQAEAEKELREKEETKIAANAPELARAKSTGTGDKGLARKTLPGASSFSSLQLKEDTSQLSEVVVTGVATDKDLRDDKDGPLIKLAEPVGGLRAYDQYLENNQQYPLQALEQKIKGRVTIQFTVGTDGSLGNFEVLKSLGYGCDDEVMRLVKEGPKWVPTFENATAVESRVRVRVKFDPARARK